MAKTMTIEAGDDGRPARPATSWRLIAAIDCASPLTRPLTVPLADVAEVVVGRGDERGRQRVGERGARLDVADAWMSTTHWRLVDDGGWVVEDADSKNGTFVNGQRVRRLAVADGDIIESGNTLFLVRADADGVAPATDAATTPLAGFHTLCPRLAREAQVLERAARSTVPVLLLGETGTGKEVLARAVHAASARRGHFIAVNCGALPETLVEAELFGSRRGAYSGATEDRSGLVRSADGGTLFLDEIAELPESSQVALLRVLQEGEVTPVGATQPVRVDIRVVAATHQDLPARMEDGRFRKDLFARLRGFAMHVPPLRERREDVGLLIAELLPRVAPEHAGRFRLQRAAARALLAHDWPLNVRELELALRAAVAVGQGDEIALDHLPEDVREARPTGSRPAGSGAFVGADGRERFEEVARQHRGNVSEIARALGTSRSQVRRLAQRFGIDLDTLRGE